MSPEREGLDVGLNGADVHALGLGPLRKQGRVVDPLRARDDLLPTDEHVVRVGVPGVVRRRHRVKRPGRERVAVQNVKVRLVLLLDEPSQGPLHLGRQVVKGVLVDAVLLEQLHALLKGEPEGWPQVLQRLEGVLLVDGLQLLLLVLQAVEHVHEELIDHVQELEVVLLDRHLEVHADELAQVAVGEGLFRAKDGADLKDSPEIRADGHLLAELRGLRQAGVAPHVLELEDGGPALARAGHDLGRVDLHKVLGQQVLPEELAHGGLDAEDGLVRGGPEVDEAVVEPGVLVDVGPLGVLAPARVRDIKGKRSGLGDNEHSRPLDLDLLDGASLHGGARHDGNAGDVHHAFLAQARHVLDHTLADHLLLLVHKKNALHGRRAVPEHHEGGFALSAHGMNSGAQANHAGLRSALLDLGLQIGQRRELKGTVCSGLYEPHVAIFIGKRVGLLLLLASLRTPRRQTLGFDLGPR
mmetsp:Transcript_4/g.11  ORF Transcript_4/g.11 Transcript_4/m.11 type:complete len:469 (-) Transcript_4:259-1665(-)